MGKVYRNKREIPVPDFAYTNQSDARVFVIKYDDMGKPQRRTIGALTSKPQAEIKMMVPNEYFRITYPHLWEEAYPGDEPPPHQMSLGMFVLTLAISIGIGLYKSLQDVYGPMHANALLDYAMYSIKYRLNVTQLFEESMSDQVIFSDKRYTDSWYSNLFEHEMTEDMNHQFRIKRIESLVAMGVRKVWLSVDGSNNDCVVQKSDLCEFGHPKSHNTNKTIVGYMYAVDAETGRPITYLTYEGSAPDCQAFLQFAVFLAGYNLEVEGVILDSGFATDEIISVIVTKKWKYVVMLPGDTHGHQLMMLEYAETIRWNIEYAVNDEGLFGIADQKKLFTNHDRIANICTFFNGISGSHQSVRLIKSIFEEKQRLQIALDHGKSVDVIKGMKKYLSVEGEGTERKVVVHFKACNKSISHKGFFSMATSDGITPLQAYRIYQMRDTSETQYSILKSQEGCSATRVHKTPGIFNKFALSFISSIVRFEIEDTCKKIHEDTNHFIQTLDRIVLLCMPDGSYEACKKITVPQKEAFRILDVDPDDLEYYARDVNYRLTNKAVSQYHTLPDKKIPLIQSNSRKRGPKPKEPQMQDGENNTQKVTVVKVKRGRPKNSKDKKPRKPRSDKGKPRKKHVNKNIFTVF